jgi:hypothetical protein
MFKLYDILKDGLFLSSGVKRGKDPIQLGVLGRDSCDHWAVKEVLGSIHILPPSNMYRRQMQVGIKILETSIVSNITSASRHQRQYTYNQRIIVLTSMLGCLIIHSPVLMKTHLLEFPDVPASHFVVQ